jgi:hypothetical protein
MRVPRNDKGIRRKTYARTVTIKLEDGSLAQGKINLLHDEAAVQRVSNIFTKLSDSFIGVFDATAKDKSGQDLILNKRKYCPGIAGI